MASNRKVIGTLGCGVESSRLPHFEQTSAPRGLICSRGQSFTSYVLPHLLQNNGSPAVMCPQLKQ
jgi:hypothetical protein